MQQFFLARIKVTGIRPRPGASDEPELFPGWSSAAEGVDAAHSLRCVGRRHLVLRFDSMRFATGLRMRLDMCFDTRVPVVDISPILSIVQTCIHAHI